MENPTRIIVSFRSGTPQFVFSTENFEKFKNLRSNKQFLGST